MIDAVVLDYGHTIVDFVLNEQALLGTYEEVRQLLVQSASRELPSAQDLVNQVSYRLAKRIEDSYMNQELQELDILQLFGECFAGLDLHLPAELIRRIAEMEHRALSSETYLPPENGAALQELRAQGLRLGLVSNMTLLGDMVREDLDRLGILELFDLTLFSSEEGVRKPHPDIYAAALQRLEIEPGRVVFVGDRLREDVGGPQAAGMKAILTRQFRQEEPGPRTPQPDAIIASLAELPKAMNDLRGVG